MPSIFFKILAPLMTIILGTPSLVAKHQAVWEKLQVR